MPMMLSVHTVKKNAEVLVAATKEIGLGINAHKTKYMTVSRDQNAGRIHSMKMDNSSIERVEEFKYLGTTLTNPNSIQERMQRVFENRVLRRVFAPKRDEVTGEWRKLHNEELRDLYPLPNIVRAVKSRRMTWAGHVARMGEGRVVHRVLVGNPMERDNWGDPDVDGRIILRWIFSKWEGVETGWSWLRIGTGGGHL